MKLIQPETCFTRSFLHLKKKSVLQLKFVFVSHFVIEKRLAIWVHGFSTDIKNNLLNSRRTSSLFCSKRGRKLTIGTIVNMFFNKKQLTECKRMPRKKA